VYQERLALKREWVEASVLEARMKKTVNELAKVERELAQATLGAVHGVR
jgi:hypothetical protein